MSQTIFVPVGYALTLTTPADAAGSYWLVGNPGDGPGAQTAILANTAVVVGPFNDPRYYAYDVNNGVMTTALAQSGVVSAADDAAIALLAPKASPTFTGTVVLPSGQALIAPALGTVASGVISACTSTSMTMVTPVLGSASATKVTITKVNGAEASNLVTASGAAGVITTSSLSAAAGTAYDITWTNTAIAATSVIQLTQLGGTNTKFVQFKVVPGSGSATLSIQNLDLLSALDGTILIGYLVV